MPTTFYEWDPISDNIVAEYDENGNVIVEYTTEPGLHGAVISEHRNGQTYYHIHDGQGNTVALTNDQGEVTDTFAYTANGELTERTGDTPTPYQYNGEHGYYTDQQTGELLVRARVLSPLLGRWLSEDPQEYATPDTNLYRYAVNRPTYFRDPSGAHVCDEDPVASVPDDLNKVPKSSPKCHGTCIWAEVPLKATDCKLEKLEYVSGPFVPCTAATFAMEAVCGKLQGEVEENTKTRKPGEVYQGSFCDKFCTCDLDKKETHKGKKKFRFEDTTISLFIAEKTQCVFKVTGTITFESPSYELMPCRKI